MDTLLFYGVIAVKFTPPNKKHVHSISHVFIIKVTKNQDTGKTIYWPNGKLITKEEALQHVKKNQLYTLVWDYKEGFWQNGAKIVEDQIGDATYLRTVPDNSVTDNLDNLIDYDFFDSKS